MEGLMKCPTCDGKGHVPYREDDDPDDWPEGDYCPGCGNPESSCICGDVDAMCRHCGRPSNCLDCGLCGMCFEMSGYTGYPY